MEKINKMAKILKVVSDPTRLTILSYLKNRELCVCELVTTLDISQPAVSQQLKKLKNAGIITERRVGTWVLYKLSEDLDPLTQVVIQNLDSLEAPKMMNCDEEE